MSPVRQWPVGLRPAAVRPAMLADTLCTRCGLCCDGTLLGDVELTGPAEAARLERLGLDVDTDDGDVLPLPCAALRGTTCSVYAQRPRSCRAFECRLLQETQRGDVSVDDALARISDARALVQQVKKRLAQMEARPVQLPLEERVAEAIASAASGPRAARRAAELDAAMAALTRAIRTTFLC